MKRLFALLASLLVVSALITGCPKPEPASQTPNATVPVAPAGAAKAASGQAQITVFVPCGMIIPFKTVMSAYEKAHPDVTNVLLQIMDNGQVTGSNGKVADCRNLILIMTSNLGAKDAERATIGFSSEDRYNDNDDAMKSFFAPEFRNRLDGIIKFNKLAKTSMTMIVYKFVGDLNDLVREKNVKVVLTLDGIELLINRGFDPKMGARPLSRIIDQEIKKPMSREMLFGKLKNGGTVTVDARNNDVKLVIEEVTDADAVLSQG